MPGARGFTSSKPGSSGSSSGKRSAASGSSSSASPSVKAAQIKTTLNIKPPSSSTVKLGDFTLKKSSSSKSVKPTTKLTSQPTPGKQLSKDQLIDKVLLEGFTQNVQQYDWWADSPDKQAAYDEIQAITSNPQALEEYVMSRGVTNLQNYWWWSDHPQKQQVWDSMAQYRDDTDYTAEALEQIVEDDRVPDELKPLFKKVVEEWNPDQEINIQNVKDAFKNIEENTIDPFFAQMTKQFVNDLTQAVDFYTQQSLMEQEQEGTLAGERIRQAKSGLEKAGMTFTGKGIEQLGAQSAFARPGTSEAAKSGMPLQTQFGGSYFEGLVPQTNRLMASSMALRQKKQMDDFARAAEMTLGSEGVASLNMGLNLQGDVEQGSIAQNRQTSKANIFNALYGQNQQLYNYAQPLSFFS